MMKNKIHPCIWCNNNAKEMATFYCNTFNDAKIMDENPMVVMLQISGQNFMLLNGGTNFKPTPAISFMALCSTAQEVETLYKKLVVGGQALMELDEYPFSKKYGWVNDKYGVSWQLYLGETGGAKEKYVPTLMFSDANMGKAEEAISFYTSVFPNSKIQGVLKYTGKEGGQAGLVQHAQFDVNDYTLMCMDSHIKHGFGFTEGISLVVNCKDQSEIDQYWKTLTANGGQESMCGWLKDKYGVSWQIVPENLQRFFTTPENTKKVMDAVMKMKKLSIEKMEEAVS